MQVTLNPPRPVDAAGLFALVDASRDSLSPWLLWVAATRGEADSAAFICRMLTQSVGGNHGWLIRVDGEIAGFCSHQQHGDAANLAYWLGQPYVGRGIMQAVLAQWLPQLFADSGIVRVEILADQANQRSWRVAERAGFQFAAHCHLPETPPQTEADARLYTLSREQWTAHEFFPR